MKNLFNSIRKFFKQAKSDKKNYFQHETAIVEDGAQIGENTKVWHYAHIRNGAHLGNNCNLGKSVFVDSGVVIGNNVKIQNFATLYMGLKVEDGVYIGPSVTFTNDKIPRAINPDGTPKSATDWTLLKTLIKKGASIGANATVLPGITIGEWSMVGAGSVVTKDVPPFSLVVGSPARVVAQVDEKGIVHKNKISAVA